MTITIELPQLDTLAENVSKLITDMEEIKSLLKGDDLLSQEEAEAYLKCSTTKLWRIVQAGEITCTKSGRDNVYRRRELYEYMTKRRAG